MEGREEITMDGRTRITWVIGPSRNARRTRPQRVTASVNERAEALRDKLIAATVELASVGSHPRLVGTRHARIAL